MSSLATENKQVYISCDAERDGESDGFMRPSRECWRSSECMCFTVMVDETDASNVEQVVICLKWISESFEVHKDFVQFMKWPPLLLRTSMPLSPMCSCI